MTKPSQSPGRHSFSRKGYIKRQKEKGEPVNEDYLDYFQKILEDHKHKFDDPETHKNNLEYDLLTTDWILDKVRASESYAQNLYAAMCNNGFIKMDIIPILKNQEWSCSWRYAGGIVADMCESGDYIDWYCSGIRGGDEPDVYEQPFTNKFVREGCITDEIRTDLQRLGWAVAPGGDWENF